MFWIVALAFCSACTLVLGAAALLDSPLERRLRQIVGVQGEGSVPAGVRVIRRLERLFAPLARIGSSALVRERLVQAGHRSESSRVIYQGGRIILALALMALALVVLLLLDLEAGRCLAGALLAGAVGFIGPSRWLDRAREKRQQEVRRHLTDALDLLAVCLEAGLGLNVALARVASELTRSSPALSDELRLVCGEIRAGKTLSDALRGFANRAPILEVRSLVAMLVQTERFGTSVSSALRVHCRSMRVERLQKAEEKAQKAAIKMLLPSALLILPATFAVTIGPGLLKALEALK